MARSREEIISEMVDSGLFTDDEIRAAVREADASKPTFMDRVIETVAAPALPILAAQGQPGALEALRRLGDPKAGQFGLGAAAEQAGEGIQEGILGAAEDVRQVGRGIEDKIFQAAEKRGLPGIISGSIAAPVRVATEIPTTAAEMYSGAFKPSEMQQELGAAALPVAGGMVKRFVGRAAFPAAVRSAASKASKISRGAPEDELKRIFEMHPEVAEPGYFKDLIDTFGKDLEKAVVRAKKKASDRIEKALKTVKKKPAMDVFDIQKIVDDEVSQIGLSASTMEFRNVLEEIKLIEKALLAKGQSAGFKDIMDFERAIFGATDSPSAPLTAKRTAAKISARLDKVFDKAPALKKARKSFHEAKNAEDMMKAAFGVNPNAKESEIGRFTQLENSVQDFLSLPETAKDLVKKTTDRLSPKLTERLEKLAAAGGGEGRLTKTQPALPSMGIGTGGFVAANPTMAVPAIGLAAGAKQMSSPFIRRAALKAAQQMRTSQLPGVRSFLPGLVGSPLIRGRE